MGKKSPIGKVSYIQEVRSLLLQISRCGMHTVSLITADRMHTVSLQIIDAHRITADQALWHAHTVSLPHEIRVSKSMCMIVALWSGPATLFWQSAC